MITIADSARLDGYGWAIRAVLAALAFLALCHPASGQEVSLTAAKGVFFPGDGIELLVHVSNPGSEKELMLSLLVEASGFEYPPAMLVSPLPLAAGESKTINISPLYVDDTMPPGEYKATVSLLEGENVLSQADVQFRVEGTLMPTDLELLACFEGSCTGLSVPFPRGSTISLEYRSSVEGLEVGSVVLLPDGSQRTLSLPASLRLDLAGRYEVRAAASKEGHKTAARTIEFTATGEGVELLEERVPVSAPGAWGGLPLGYIVIIAIAAAVLLLGILRLLKRI